MKLSTIIAEIHTMGSEDLKAVAEALQYARAQNHKASAKALQKGDVVEFTGRGGKTVQGTVIKTKIKYVHVDCGMDGKWNVPGAQLRKVA